MTRAMERTTVALMVMVSVIAMVMMIVLAIKRTTHVTVMLMVV
jgi:hypothetical protein